MKAHTKENKFWKVEIIGMPASAFTEVPLSSLTESEADMYGYYEDEFGPDALVKVPVENWEPEGWLATPEARQEWADQTGTERFFWPTTNRLYQTRGSARARARLLEAYGASVRIVESDPLVWLTPEILRERKIQHLKDQLEALEASPAAA